MRFHLPLLRPFRVLNAWGWPAPMAGRWCDEGLEIVVERAPLGVPLQLPLRPGVYRLTSPYGYRIAPAGPYKGKRHLHNGIDLAAPTGTPIYAAASGRVVSRYYADQPSGKLNGNAIVIQHSDGMRTAYLHMSRVLVSQGQQLAAGDQVGEVGATGDATGPHLHFIVYQSSGATTDPSALLPGGAGTGVQASTAPSSPWPEPVASPLPAGPSSGAGRAVAGVLMAMALVGLSVVGVAAWRARRAPRRPGLAVVSSLANPRPRRLRRRQRI